MRPGATFGGCQPSRFERQRQARWRGDELPSITEVHWALWYGLVYAAAGIGAWLLVTVVWLFAAWRRRTRAAPPAVRREPPALEDDPELHRFFAAVNHAYQRRPPPHAYAPPPSHGPTLGQPRVLRVRADPELVAEVPGPEPVRTLPDPEVLHSAPFYSPREAKPARPCPDPRLVLEATAEHKPVQASADSDLAALMSLWSQLSPKDRRELLLLAQFKAQPNKQAG
jgi:hypothetical protein